MSGDAQVLDFLRVRSARMDRRLELPERTDARV